MIHIGSESPSWLRELSRFLPLKNLLFVHGNILDKVSFPRSKSGDISWTESDLPEFFERFLQGYKYGVVGSFDPVDGLSFPNPHMEDMYNKIRRGKDISSCNKKAENAQTSGSKAPGGFNSSGHAGQSGMKKTQSYKRYEPNLQKRGATENLEQIIDGIGIALKNQTTPCAFVANLASRLESSLADDERKFFTKILKNSLNSKEVILEDCRLNNILILICDKLNDLPAFLYLNNPRARSIFIRKPDTSERTRFIKRNYRAFHGVETGRTDPSTELVYTFAALTEGLTNYEMNSLISLSLKEKISINNIQNICERYKFGITKSEWDKIDKAKLEGAEESIRTRVKGQREAVARVLDIIKRAKIGLAAGAGAKSSRPRGVLFFAGPTGVGKTEMAKAMAELLFGQEDRCIRFDMSEYSAEHADQKLMGAPPGYVGYEEGGQLTNAIKERPFSILLFDEIEKAHGSIFDKFLQILDDGRLTNGKGETVYFSECIIIFTSNLGTVSRSESTEMGSQTLVNPEMPYSKMKEEILKAIRDHFNFTLGRPEILNRFGDNFVVFDFIKPPLDEDIVDLLITRLREAIKETKKIDLIIESPVREKIISLARENLQHGGRGIRNVIDSSLVNPLNRIIFDRGIEEKTELRLTQLRDNGQDAINRFELDIAIKKL